MEEEIAKAKRLLAENGYIVKKWTHSMEEDANECEDMEEKGLEKDCCSCSCSICLIQWIRNSMTNNPFSVLAH